MIKNKKIGVISLGCDKNRVDTEKMLAIICQRHVLTPKIEEAEIIIINTCAFLESARKEAIEEILLASSFKQVSAEKIIVTGCLPQKFVDDMKDELLEVDAFMGVSDYADINQVIDEIYTGKRVILVGKPREEYITKRVLTTKDYAYLKIADGCNNHCTYCLIPKIRGKYRSVKLTDLIEEAKGLGQVKELILVAQDLTKYGCDLSEKVDLVGLIQSISKLDNINSIRLMYCYPENITPCLIEEIKTNDKVLKYIDIPLQHADDKILKLMGRKGSKAEYLSLINKLKEQIEGIAIRSTFITGFPNEDQVAFDNLVDFIEKAQIHNAGFFKYSREEDTPAYNLKNQVEEKIKNSRLKKLYLVQKKVAVKLNKAFIGKTIKVLAEGFDQNALVYYGRSYFNAPDIDGKVYFFSKDEVERGNYYDIKITKVDGLDLYGERL